MTRRQVRVNCGLLAFDVVWLGVDVFSDASRVILYLMIATTTAQLILTRLVLRQYARRR